MITDTALRFEVNGRGVEVRTDGRRRLVDVLREDLGLTGTKVGCNAGDCGACTVRLDGEQVCACLVAAGQVDGRRVETVEGLAGADGPSALQAAFLACGGAQCGACTPGMLMAAGDLIARTPSPTAAEVLDGLGGVLCRCTGYTSIVDAVRATRVGRRDLRAGPGGRRRGRRAHRPHRRAGQGHRGRAVRRRPAGRRRVAPAGGPLATRACALPRRRPRAGPRPPPGSRPDPGRRRRPGRQPVRDLRDRQGPAGPRRGLRPVPRRGRAGARRRRGDRGLDRRRRAADRVDAAAAADRDRRRAGPVRAPAPRGLARQRADRGPRAAGRRRRRPGRGRRDRDRDVRDHLRRARLHRARGGDGARGRRARRGLRDHPDAVHGPRRAGAGARAARGPRPRHPERVRRRVRRQARPVAAAPDRDRRAPARPPGPRGLSAAGVDGRDDQAPSGQDHGHVRRRRGGAAHRRPRPRRLRHRRLRVVGPDGRQPRPGPRDGPVRGQLGAQHEPGRVHERAAGRGLPRLRRPAGGDRPRGAPGRPGRAARHRPARDPRPQRAPRGVADRDVPGARRERRPARLPRRPAAALDRHARGGGSGQRGRGWTSPPRRRGGGHVVRHRQHVAPQPVRDRDRHPRRRHRRPVLRGDRHRPGLEHDPRPDRRRRAGGAGRVDRARRSRHRPHPGRRQDLGVAPDVRVGERDPDRRARTCGASS